MPGLSRSVRVLGRLAALGLCGWASARAEDAPKPAPAAVDFDRAVRPILADRCYACHGPDGHARKAELRLDVPPAAMAEGVVVAGKPGESELIARVSATDDTRMPPASSHLPLSASEVETLRRWVAEGAVYQPHWAFVPPAERVPEPAVSDPNWPASALDRFVLARLDREGLRPSPPAGRDDWLRRATFDLTGLPPTPGQADAFAADASPEAFAKAADRLLASPRFGERLALDWLDASRYADSFGYQSDEAMDVWPWRDWVVRAFNAGLPYDQFLTWQLAGDLLPNPTADQRLATAFNRLHRLTGEGGSIAEEWRNESVSDRVATFGTAVLGLTLECARCHDHKYDPLSAREYYGLGAFFNSIDEWGTYNHSEFRPTPTLAMPTPKQAGEIAALRAEVARLASNLSQVAVSREPAFREWLAGAGRTPEVPGLLGDYPLDGPPLENRVAGGKPATSGGDNGFEAGRVGRALRFSGDDPAEFAAGPARVDRSTPFSLAFWLRAEAVGPDVMVCHRSTGTDTGFNGAELTLTEGRLRFALVRFWPGNALAVRTAAALPARRWVHVGLTYDGSGSAGGVALYLDGRPAAVEVVRDCLTKDVQAPGPGFVFGERTRTAGLRGGLVDDLKVAGRILTPVEVAQLADGHSLADALARRDADALRPYYLATADPEVAKALAALRAARDWLFAVETGVFEVLTMAETPVPRPTFVLARGNYDAPKDRPVGRIVPAALPPLPPGAPRDRLGLARWVTGPSNPLTARVAVNRYWQLFFGRGLVATAENFGTQGSPPTHPELLDRLARDFVASGWDVKRFCREVVLSSTYRQSSAASAALRERDPENSLLARGPSRRLSAEAVRDAALAASGLLSERQGGPPVKPPMPPGLWKGQNPFLPEYAADAGADARRRSLYTFWRRTSPPPNMLAFDAPGREVCVVRRQPTSTPLQPLVLMNDPQFVEAAVALGASALRDGGPTTEARVVSAFRRAASRRPTDHERALLVRLYHDQLAAFRANPDEARAFLKPYGEAVGAGGDLDPAEAAASAATAGVILNLDASQTTR